MDTNELHARWRQNPTAQNASDVLDSLSPDMDRAIQAHGGQPSPLTRGLAKRTALDAMQSFDPKGGASFRSWAQTQFQRLSRPLRQAKFTMRVPELRAQEATRVRSLISDLEAQTGFEPSDAQLADHLGISLKRIASARTATTPEIVSSDIDPPEEADEGAMVQDMVYHSLPPRDQLIMERILGYNRARTVPAVELARKLGVSPAAISQRVAKIQGLLQEAQKLHG